MAEVERLQRAQNFSEVKSLLDDLRNAQLGPSLLHYNIAIDRAVKERDWPGALKLFYSLTEVDNLTPTVVTYNLALRACEKTGQWERALALFESMTERHAVHPNVITVASTIGALSHGGQWSAVLDLYDIATNNHGFILSPHSYNAVLSASLNAHQGRHWRRAIGVIDEMRARGHTPDYRG